MEYKVITGHTLESLQRSVNDFLEIGWELQGGVCSYITNFSQQSYFAQAIFKIK
jgi:hypothetical protein